MLNGTLNKEKTNLNYCEFNSIYSKIYFVNFTNLTLTLPLIAPNLKIASDTYETIRVNIWLVEFLLKTNPFFESICWITQFCNNEYLMLFPA